MEIVGYLLAIAMGGVLGLIGGGGSILSVPIFVYFFQLDASQATAYSLFVVGIAAAFAAWDYNKRKLINYRVGIYFAVPAFLGVYLVRRLLIPWIPQELGSFVGIHWTKDTLILVVFALVMLVASTMMIRKPKSLKIDSESKSKIPNPLYVTLEGLFVGGLTGFVGAGGGFMIIPALVLLAGLEMKVAVGTSLFIITIKSLIGFIGDVQSNSTIDWGFLVLFSVFAVVGILIGTQYSRRVDSKKLKPAFGWFILVMGFIMLSKELFL